MNFVIIHGTGGSPSGNWFPWLTEQLKSGGHSVLCPQFPTPEGQSLTSWLQVFDTEYGMANLDDSTVLVGHSCGVPCSLRILELSNQPIAACFLIAGLTGELGLPQFDELNQTFVDSPFDWASIKNSVRDVYVYHSPDDPYVPIEQSREIAHSLDAVFREIPNGGHLNAEFGYTEFEELMRDIEDLL